MNPSDFSPPGWHLIGQFKSGVGSWLLHHGGEAALLEIPEGLTVHKVNETLKQIGDPRLRYIMASHEHEDHFNDAVWDELAEIYRMEMWTCPVIMSKRPRINHGQHDIELWLGDEPLYLIYAPKHSLTDMVTIFRGVAMTGDIELGTLDSVNDEVPLTTRRRSMKRLAGFEERNNYRVHTVFSAHLDDLRTNVDWKSLFCYIGIAAET